MCGIVGYIGSEQAAPILLEGLERLEYRGYDSAGVSVYTPDGLKVVKAQGRLSVLSGLIGGGSSLEGTAGIGHTRWATHGQPSDQNSHPHLSSSGKIAVVHNGIIENYLRLREMLQRQGVVFSSETDTEVIAQLIDYYYDGDLLDAVQKTIAVLEGSYALGIMSSDYPDRLIAVRKDTPLILAFSETGNFITSDVTAVLKYTREVAYLDDGEIAVVTRERVSVYNQYLEEIKPKHVTVDWDVSAAEKGGYPHFMLKEIMEQPKAILDTIKPRIKDGKIVLEGIDFTRQKLENIRKICILACGSAYHVGYVAKYIFEKMLRKPVEIEVASEFRYMEPIIDENVLVIAISQSGETADTLAAVREAKKLGAKVLSIVNVVGSSIANVSDDVLYTWAGPEIAVATTKAYSTQLSVIYMLALYMAEKLGKLTTTEYNILVEELLSIPEKVEKILQQDALIKSLAEKFCTCNNVFFIGRNVDYAVSLEGSLKLKEISYIHSEAYPAGELKHGTISLIDDGTLVVALATHDKLFDKMVSNIKEVKARGAVVLSITTEEKRKEIEGISDFNICVPQVSEVMSPSMSVVPLQLFAYYIAAFKGCDIDKPRNLAKSVTVE